MSGYCRVCQVINKALPPNPPLRYTGLSLAAPCLAAYGLCIMVPESSRTASSQKRVDILEIQCSSMLLYSKADALVF
ncbi:hypothetical protein T440DRAFT_528490 [Plenodomus tracheiphilus IPT5]|uniref:Uncharacterized protein n=1 Tax=Plenodomus tracheiphilus IPT5 TaxID=1408161 RepID=A0A6A7ALP1_9PLEO|nr:hypothetical protein T440DRAFT_528490 [Plenodomus tracheiphilus IPT5]